MIKKINKKGGGEGGWAKLGKAKEKVGQCKKDLKRGQSRSVFVQKVLYVLCHLCSISKSTDSSHLSFWPWTLPQHSPFLSTQAKGCSDGWLYSLSPTWTPASSSLWFNNEWRKKKKKPQQHPNWNSLGGEKNLNWNWIEHSKVTSWHCMKLKTAWLWGERQKSRFIRWQWRCQNSEAKTMFYALCILDYKKKRKKTVQCSSFKVNWVPLVKLHEINKRHYAIRL